jgi:NTE family protein
VYQKPKKLPNFIKQIHDNLKPINKAFLPSIFPLFVAIFLFLKKKQKGFPLQSGLDSHALLYLPLVFCLLPFATFAQDDIKKPKIGLVLSGGGAKGLAHIGVLKEIEKAGIKIDYIGGTSMGAIVGGLYACGYSANQLDSIFNDTDFDKLIQDFVPRNNKTFFEKRNDEIYAITLPFKKLKLSIPKGISKGLYNYNLLSKLTHDYRHIRDFSKLKIPFLCVATNLETGEETILKEGSLPLALLASGAFPSLFSPVEIEDKVYIDGGVVNNYPIEEVRKMGADIIIGVDVQDDLKKRDEINGATGILVQISNFQMIQNMNQKKENTDIYIKPDIEGYSVISFDQGKEIIKKGEEAAQKVKEKLEKIGNQNFTIQKKVTVDSVYINDVSINEIQNYTRSYIMGKLRFKPKQKISYQDLHSGINNLSATQNFSAINYDLIKEDTTDFLLLNLKENPIKTYLKLGVHFDDLFKTAALINLTKKNLFLTNDVISTDIMLGDNIRYNLDYFRDNGYYISFGFKSKFNKFKRQSKTDFKGNKILNSFSLNDIDVKYSDFSNLFYIQTIFAQKYLIGAGIESKYINITSNFFQDKKTFIENNTYLTATGFFKYDSFSNKYFPKRGWYFFGDIQSFLTSVKKSEVAKFTIFKADAAIAQTFYKKTTLKLQAEAGLSVGDKSNNIFDFSLGGFGFNALNNFRPFYGYDFLDLSGNSYIKISSVLDYEFIKKNHLNLTANFANIGRNIYERDTWISTPTYSGYAIGYGIETLIGPLEIKQSWSPETNNNYTWFSIGFWF